MASLSRSAARFKGAFPSVNVDRRKLDRALKAFDFGRRAPRTRLSNLATALVFDPPVDDLAVPFAQELIVSAGRRMGAGAQDAEDLAAGYLEGMFELCERPLFGLQISIGAPRRGVQVTALSHADQIIEDLHARLDEAFARPVGPQEHVDGLVDSEAIPSTQWRGHITDRCVPAYRHDVLVVLAGRSIGVGESIAIAGSLLVPVFAIIEPPAGEYQSDDESYGIRMVEDWGPGTSCRVRDQDAVTLIRPGSTASAEIAERVVTALVAASPDIRLRQRARIRNMLELGEYRSYLCRRLRSSTGASARRRVQDPFEFASLTELQRDRLAAQLDAITSTEYSLVSLLGREARAGFKALLDSADPPKHAAGLLLRAGMREMAQFADEPLKASRPFVWDEAGWRRLWNNMGRP